MIDCGELYVPAAVMQHVVRVESGFNPYAIGVVKGRLSRQPKNLPEALATVKMLEEAGYNFSVGIAQVNRYNLKKYGLGNYTRAFDTCSNLRAGSKILQECYISAGRNWGKAFSCYYSGNFVTGYRHGYVQKVFDSIRKYGSPHTTMGVLPATLPVNVRKMPKAVKAQTPPVPAVQAAISRAKASVAVPSVEPEASFPETKVSRQAEKESRDGAFVF